MNPSPLRTAYRSILASRTAYRHFVASHTTYRLTTKNNHFGRFHLHKENDIMSHQWRKLAYSSTHVRLQDGQLKSEN